MSWQDFGPTKPLPVDGGLVARSARGDIGQLWWSRRFVEVLESFALGTRLTRGRAYARKGQVISLSVAPGIVTAHVQGSRRTPYAVRVAISPFTELVWAKVEVALAEQAVHSARLLAGTMPPDLEGVFVAAGAPLFPTAAGDLTMRCSCPDATVPCKHIAATFYLLAERFDDDPFEILHWRGRPRARLLERLAALRSQGDDDVDDSAAAAGDAGAGPEPAGEPGGALRALAPRAGSPVESAGAAPVADVGHGWAPAPMLPALPAHSPLPADLLLRQLATPPRALGGDDLVAELSAVYASVGAVEGPS